MAVIIFPAKRIIEDNKVIALNLKAGNTEPESQKIEIYPSGSEIPAYFRIFEFK